MFRYAGRLSGLYPVSSPIMALQVDEILHVLKAFSDDVLLHDIALYCWVKSIRKIKLAEQIDKHKCIVAVEAKDIPLTYFPFPGRAEPIRLALFIAGIPFDDERIDACELNRKRSTLPFNQLPVLEVDGEVVSQALGILRYVGTLGGLYSASKAKEAFRNDEVFALIDEFYSSYAWNASYFEADPAKQKQLRTRLAKETLPNTLSFLERRTSKWNERHAVGNSLTVADLAISSLLWTFRSGRILGVPVSVVAPFKKLLSIYDVVAEHPKVGEWGSMKH
ncbi:glutathione S-transferase, putative [Phytophthora infestans T30-4]|uniref:Glutathione S-transferase, putative n=1 Tax=Phytophthora infestans (strain T30-4) TaxID=403677 RepID=D0MZP6_PHYIT|nr:glutathione S-transferase, putative [Phytophthora infestans T30-4]EEY65709.1 glutathione S-transferase, putative [Phytophthora infestans T30-4]|eukprot:XP_002906308.1 glutathione S-transferase, putative [Phytophthora infestans T30-4]